MVGILNEMFEGLVVYVWKPFVDEDGDHKAVLISAKDFSEVQELTGEYPSDEYVVESFDDLLDVLWDREIPYQNLSDIIHYHIHKIKEVEV